MAGMRELYQKVAKSKMLQKKLVWIANEAEAAGEKKTNDRLIFFAKEAGYDITIEEMQAFFQELSEQQHEELSEAELDLVAGGKSAAGIISILSSVFTLGLTCAVQSAARVKMEDGCGGLFE